MHDQKGRVFSNWRVLYPGPAEWHAEVPERRMAMRGHITTAMLASCVVLWGQEAEQARLKAAADVVTELTGTPDKGIPRDLLDKAECALVFPSVKKAAFIVGGSYGRGVIS